MPFKTHSMATERFISDNARQRILREIVLRTQKAVYHALHPWYVGIFLTSSQTDNHSGSIQAHPRLSWLPPFEGLPDVFMLLRALSFRCSESQGPKVVNYDATQVISDFLLCRCLMPSS